MEILSGEELVKRLRELGDAIKRRLWIAVPYIGNSKLVRQALGNNWLSYKKIDVRLLTDVNNKTYLSYESLLNFHKEGEVRSIPGLHAKIYILDDNVLVSSANLTRTAFTMRHEIGVFLSGKEIGDVISYYEAWWNNESEKVCQKNLDSIAKSQKSHSHKSNDEPGGGLNKLYNIPPDPGNPKDLGNHKMWFVNTNKRYCYNNECELDMLKHHKAAAYYNWHKFLIDKLRKDNVVFLYSNKVGIIAMGIVATGKRKEKLPPHRPDETQKEEYYMDLDDFVKIKSPITAGEIRTICKRNVIFNQAVSSIDEECGKKIMRVLRRNL